MSDTPRTDAVYDVDLLERGIQEHGRTWGWGTVSDFRELCRQLERELTEATAENIRLRAALASSKDPCVYCQLPKDEMAKCRSGFPGCGRADDLMGCPELGAALEADELKRELADANHRIRRLIEERDSARIQADQKWKLREEFEALLGTNEVEVGVEKIKKMKAFIDGLEEIGRHTGETAKPEWHGGAGWLHHYIGEEKP